jgi:DNA-binding response OmpR family regulator
MHYTPPSVAGLTAPIEARTVVKRGAVTMSVEPTEFFWNDARIALSPVESALLSALMRRSRLRWTDANAVLVEHGGSTRSRDVLIHRIRRKFAEIGAADPIETLRGWGIRFRTEPDRDGSSAFWIGATEVDPPATF